VRHLPAVALLVSVLAAPAFAEDIVRLRRGGSLRGEVRSQTEHEIILEIASGEIRIPRSQIARVEMARDGEAIGVRLVKRDEWSLLTHDKRVAGWIRILHWERGDLVHVEEQRVTFATADSPRRERRRVEIVDRDGRPREYLWMESEVGQMELWSGQIRDGRHVRQHRKGGRVQTEASDWPEHASLPLPTWVHTLDNLESLTRRVLDPRKGSFEERRFERSSARYFGAQRAGRIVATTPERVAFARRVHARPDPLAVAADAKLHPLTPRNPERQVHHVAAGVSLTAPDAIWVDSVEAIDRGRLLLIENRASFSRVELYVGVAGADPWKDLRRQLLNNHDHFAKVGEPVDGLQRIEVRQGKERMLGLLRVVRRGSEYVAIVGLIPLRKWTKERAAVARILNSVQISR